MWSSRSRERGHPLLCVLVLLAACTGGDDSPGSTGEWTEPGLVDCDGEPVDVEPPDPATGRELLVTDFGADPDSDDDAPALRAAIEEAEAGDTVVLPEGTFDLSSPDPAEETTHVLLRSGVHLRGAGPDRTELVSDFDGDDDTAVLLGAAVDDVVVTDLTVTSTHDGPLGTDTDDDAGGGGGGGGPMFGIRIAARDGQASNRVLVEDVRVERFQRHGITLKGTREVVVRGCHVAAATSVGPGGAGYGIAVEGHAEQRDPDAGDDSRHNVLTRNVLDGEHLRHAILLQFPTHNNLIDDNLVVGSRLDAIDLHGEAEYLNEIRGNTVVGGRRAGIALGNPGGTTHRHAASGEGNWVHDNDLVGNEEGIVIILGTPDTRVERNRILAGEDADVGIEVDDGPGTIVRDNVLVTAGGVDPLRLDDDVEATGNRVVEPDR